MMSAEKTVVSIYAASAKSYTNLCADRLPDIIPRTSGFSLAAFYLFYMMYKTDVVERISYSTCVANQFTGTFMCSTLTVREL